jgi:salicylate hydroxylase
MTRVVIIGAGIGGLAAALALRKSGLDVVVLEQADRLQAVGAGIQLSPNANHVLARLGVLDAIIDVAFEPRSLDIVDGQRGRTLLSAPLGQRARTRYGQPYLNVHRGDLQTVLLDVVNATIPTAVELDCHVTSVVQGDDGVTVGLHDGRTVRADMVIGADGVHSVVRQHVVTETRPARFTGHVAYRMLIPRSAIPADGVPAPSVTLRVGPHGHIVSYWVRGGALYNVVAIIEDSQWRGESWRTPADLGAVRAAFQEWDPRLRALFGAAGDIHKWALLDHPVPAVWSRGRVALLGDACHAMLPYLAQGGAMAIEDAWALGEVLADATDPVAALSRYSQLRVARATRVHAHAARNARTFHRSRRASRFARDAVLRALARKPERFLHRMDWLYGLDITQPRMLIGSARHPRADHSAGQQHRHGYR